MTESASSSDPTELDGQRIRGLFRLLDDLLDEPTSILVVGGAALSVHWHDQSSRPRATRDIDFAPIAYDDFPERSTFKVDIDNLSMPDHLEKISRIIASRHPLDVKWLNNDVVNVMKLEMKSEMEYEPEVMFRGERLTVYRPSLKVLFAMKLKARREAKDLSDAVQLALETGINSTEKMLRLVEDAFGEENIDFDVHDFIDDVDFRYQMLHGRERGRFSERDFGL